MNSKSHYLYISSKNRSENENIYNFNVILNNPIILNRNQGINISVIGFSMMNTDYNLRNISFELINKSSEPLKAYTILFNVQKKGIKAPPQVYRALDKLVEIGKIHKIESKNAFVACRNSDCEISKATAFSICESCEIVDEISDVKLSKYLSNFNHNGG